MRIVLGLLNIMLGAYNIMIVDTRYNVAVGVFCLTVGVNLLMREGQS